MALTSRASLAATARSPPRPHFVLLATPGFVTTELGTNTHKNTQTRAHAHASIGYHFDSGGGWGVRISQGKMSRQEEGDERTYGLGGGAAFRR